MGKPNAPTLHSKTIVGATGRSPLLCSVTKVIGKKVNGCAIIAAAILWRALILDRSSPTLFGDIYYRWVLLFPLFSLSLSALVFLALAFTGTIKPAKEWDAFLVSVLRWAIAGIGIAFVVIIAITAYYNSPQGPLALILDGPLGAAVGIIVGLVFWILNRKSDHSAS